MCCHWLVLGPAGGGESLFGAGCVPRRCWVDADHSPIQVRHWKLLVVITGWFGVVGGLVDMLLGFERTRCVRIPGFWVCGRVCLGDAAWPGLRVGAGVAGRVVCVV